MNIKKINPAVDKKILVLLAGLMWCGVGIMLIMFAIKWLTQFGGSGKVIFYLCGFLAAMPIHHFGFLKIADKNLNRLLPITEKKFPWVLGCRKEALQQSLPVYWLDQEKWNEKG